MNSIMMFFSNTNMVLVSLYPSNVLEFLFLKKKLALVIY